MPLLNSSQRQFVRRGLKGAAALAVTYVVGKTMFGGPPIPEKSTRLIVNRQTAPFTVDNTNYVPLHEPQRKFVEECDVPSPQPCVISNSKLHSLFLWIRVRHDCGSWQVARAVSHLQDYVREVTGPMTRGSPDEVLAGVGFGPEFYARVMGGSPQPFSNRAILSETHVGGDILIHAKSHHGGSLVALSRVIQRALPPNAVLSIDETYCYANMTPREMLRQSGYDPLGPVNVRFTMGELDPAVADRNKASSDECMRRASVVISGPDEAIVDSEGRRLQAAVDVTSGGSYVLTQKWISDARVVDTCSGSNMEEWLAQDWQASDVTGCAGDEKQQSKEDSCPGSIVQRAMLSCTEKWIDRAYQECVEMRKKMPEATIICKPGAESKESCPPRQRPFRMLHQSMPYAVRGADSGIFFIAYAASPRDHDLLVERLATSGSGRKGSCDDLNRLSHTVSSACWYFPSASDPCSDYRTLDQAWRATTFTPGPNDPLQCDRFLDPGWYRFAQGGMPVACPASFSCGTQAPIWMRGQLPLPNEGVVNRSACAVTANPRGVLDCCGQEVVIQVRNCGDFLVYCLQNTPGCAMAYCSDAEGGTVPRQINTPPERPVLAGPEVVDGGFRFSCNLPDPGSLSAVYEVTWTFDGQQAAGVAIETIQGDNRMVYLDQRAWTGHLGTELRCRVRTRDGVTGQFGDFVDSNGYWGGIRVTPTSVTVTEGEGAQEVTLTSTLPVVCSHDHECELQLELDVSGTRWEDIAATESCLLHLRREDWDPSTSSASVSTRIIATRDVMRDGDQSLVVRFRPLFSLAPPLWHGYNPPDIQVRTVDRTVARCYGYADPHIQAFDRQGVYHLYEEGDFVLLRSVQNNLEVQVRTSACAGRACICGVAVQRDYDAICLSVCEANGVLPPVIRVLSEHGLQPSTTISRAPDGREYMVAFATGEWVKVTDFSSYLNVEVQVTGSEFGHTSGLCGTFDNNTANDFVLTDGSVQPESDVPRAFTESWRLQTQDSLFSGVLRPVTEGYSRDHTQLCTCNADSGTIDCGLSRGIMDTARELRRNCNHCDITDDVIRWRVNNGVEDDTEDFNRPIVLIDNGPVTPPPTPVPVTSREAATRVCISAMMNLTLTAHCATAVKVRLDSFVTSCVEDMMSAGNQKFLLAAVASWERTCAGDVLSNPETYELDKTGRLQPPPVLTSEVCPGVCGLRGRCVDGACVCDPGYTGENCFVRADNPPVILRMLGNGLCDARRRPCQRAFLQVDNFWPGPATACRIRDVQMTPTGLVPDTQWREVAVTAETDRQVACSMPDSRVPDDVAVRAYFVSITTDGARYSNEALCVVYDAVCLQCEVTGTCNLRPGACLIDSRCYEDQQINPLNSNVLCDPSRSTTQWSPAVIPVGRDAAQDEITCLETTSTFKRWDVWTSNQTGCICHFNPTSSVCACCEAGACQCPLPDMHQCVLCGMESRDCGQRHPAPEFGVDGWTLSMTGCACAFDWSREDCACCQNGGCQCPLRFRNQCTPCGHPEVCGTKPDVFSAVQD